MSTNKPRLTLTLEPDVADQVARLARIQGCPKSRVLSDLLEGVGPVLAKVADTLEMVQRVQKGARAGLARALDETEAELQPMVAAVLAAYDGLGKQIGAIADRIEAEDGPGLVPAQPGPARAVLGAESASSDPRPVTTGVTAPRNRGNHLPRPRPIRRS